MIDSSKKRNLLVGVEVLSPYVIERRSNDSVVENVEATSRTHLMEIIDHIN